MSIHNEHEGRRYLVVGGARGIGLAFAQGAVARGAQVCILDKDHDALDGLMVDGGFAGALYCDVSQPDQIDQSVEQAIDALGGGLDGLVYSVGIDLESSFETMNDDEWLRVIDINLTAPMRISRAVIPYLRQGAGDRCIINVSSAAGLSPLPGRSAYCVSKAGLNMLGKCLAQELGEGGIRVVTVAPGAVDTPLLRTSYEDKPDSDDALARIRARYALRRIAHVDEVAASILYLCGPGASYVTGTILAVDGGRSFH